MHAINRQRLTSRSVGFRTEIKVLLQVGLVSVLEPLGHAHEVETAVVLRQVPQILRNLSETARYRLQMPLYL
jgi:hypothetical protein